MLIKDGYQAAVYGNKKDTADSLKEAADARTLICGIPFTKNQIDLCALVSKKDLTLEQLKAVLSPGQILYGGNIPKDFADYCLLNGVEVNDFMKDKRLTLFNTIATAEGAIAEALIHQPTNLHKASCLILGYGKCAKVLAKKLRGMEANVTICARSEEDLSLANAFGYELLPLKNWKAHLKEYEYIFNTVPSVILNKHNLREMQEHVIIIDIASRPGGVDYEAAKEMNINARWTPGLPGQYAPLSSAEALVKTILSNRGI